jgi:hypothetical protein
MAEQQLLIPEDTYITPLKEILSDVTPLPTPKPQRDLDSIKKSLDTLFPEQQKEDRDIQKAKEILGALANLFPPVELKDTVVKMQFLAESWLDDFEREIFDGKTLNELLHEKGGL